MNRSCQGRARPCGRAQARSTRGKTHHSPCQTSLMYPRLCLSCDLVISSRSSSGPHTQSSSGRRSGLRNVSARHTIGSLHRAKRSSWQPVGVTCCLYHWEAGQYSSLSSARRNSGVAKKPRSYRNSPMRLRRPDAMCGPDRMSNRSEPSLESSG